MKCKDGRNCTEVESMDCPSNCDERGLFADGPPTTDLTGYELAVVIGIAAVIVAVAVLVLK